MKTKSTAAAMPKAASKSKAQRHADSHGRILTSAAAELRRSGLQGASVAQVMHAAGLTVGGFYAHFDSKQGLVQAAFAAMVNQASGAVDRFPGKTRSEKAGAFLDFYLSPAHRDAEDQGCPIAALAGEIARSNPDLRQTFAEGLNALSKARAEALLGQSDKAAIDEALFIISSYVGALVLARATQGTPISDRLLTTVKKRLQERLP